MVVEKEEQIMKKYVVRKIRRKTLKNRSPKYESENVNKVKNEI